MAIPFEHHFGRGRNKPKKRNVAKVGDVVKLEGNEYIIVRVCTGPHDAREWSARVRGTNWRFVGCYWCVLKRKDDGVPNYVLR